MTTEDYPADDFYDRQVAGYDQGLYVEEDSSPPIISEDVPGLPDVEPAAIGEESQGVSPGVPDTNSRHPMERD